MKKALSTPKILTTVLLTALTAALCLTACSTGSGSPIRTEGNQAVNVPGTTIDPGSIHRPDNKNDLSFSNVSTVIELADGNIKIDGEGATAAGKQVLLTAGGTYTVRGTLSDGQLVINAPKSENVKLVLEGADVSCADGAAINCVQADNLLVILADGTENRLSDGASYKFGLPDETEPNAALFSKCDLTFEGNGKLTVEAHFKHGIATKDDLYIKSGVFRVSAPSDAIRGKDSVTVKSGTFELTAEKDGLSASNGDEEDKGWISIETGSFTVNAAGDGIQAESSLLISGGTFDITTRGKPNGTSGSQKGIKAGTDILIENGSFRFETKDDSIHASRDMTIDGGVFSISTDDDGVHADRTLTINGGDFRIPDCYEGLESTLIVINGGSIFISSRDDAIGASANTAEAIKSNDRYNGNSAVKVYVNGGEIEAESSGDTIDSNGDIYVSGGRLRLSSPADPYYEGALLCNGTVHVSGGDIALVGNVGVEFTAENQPVLFISHSSTQKAGSVVSLCDAEGNELQSVTSRRDFRQTMFTSPLIEPGGTYTVLIDGVRKTEITAGGMINKAADDGGTFTGGYPRGHW